MNPISKTIDAKKKIILWRRYASGKLRRTIKKINDIERQYVDLIHQRLSEIYKNHDQLEVCSKDRINIDYHSPTGKYRILFIMQGKCKLYGEQNIIDIPVEYICEASEFLKLTDGEIKTIVTADGIAKMADRCHRHSEGRRDWRTLCVLYQDLTGHNLFQDFEIRVNGGSK